MMHKGNDMLRLILFLKLLEELQESKEMLQIL